MGLQPDASSYDYEHPDKRALNEQRKSDMEQELQPDNDATLLAAQQAELQELRIAVSNRDSVIEELQRTLSDTEEHLARAQVARAGLERRIMVSQASSQSVQAAKDALLRRAIAAECQLQAHLLEVRRTGETGASDMVGCQDQLVKAQQQAEEAVAQQQQQTEMIAELTRQLHADNAVLERERETVSENGRLSEMVEALTRQVASLGSQNAALKEESVAAERFETVEALASQVISLQTQNVDLQQEVAAARQIAQEAQGALKHNEALERQLYTLEVQITRLQQDVVVADQAAREAQQALQQAVAGSEAAAGQQTHDVAHDQAAVLRAQSDRAADPPPTTESTIRGGIVRSYHTQLRSQSPVIRPSSCCDTMSSMSRTAAPVVIARSTKNAYMKTPSPVVSRTPSPIMRVTTIYANGDPNDTTEMPNPFAPVRARSRPWSWTRAPVPSSDLQAAAPGMRCLTEGDRSRQPSRMRDIVRERVPQSPIPV